MRTNIDIDDDLMRQAMAASEETTKKAAVEKALRLLVDLKSQAAIRKLRGQVVWRGHDDNWLESDGEILRKRGAVENASDLTHSKTPAVSSPVR